MVGYRDRQLQNQRLVANGQIGLYADRTGVTFDDAKAYDTASRDPKASKLTALAKNSLSSSTVLVEASSQFGGDSFSTATIKERAVRLGERGGDIHNADSLRLLNGSLPHGRGTERLGTNAEIWGRYTDAHNGTMLKLDSSGNWNLYSFGSGGLAILGSGTYTTGASVPVWIKFNSTSQFCEVYINGTSWYLLRAVQTAGQVSSRRNHRQVDPPRSDAAFDETTEQC